MIAITAPLWLWSGAGGAWHFVTVPAAAAIDVKLEAMAEPRRGFGSIRVVARIGAIQWRTSIFPQKSGDYILPVKADVRRRAGIAAGDEVDVLLDLA